MPFSITRRLRQPAAIVVVVALIAFAIGRATGPGGGASPGAAGGDTLAAAAGTAAAARTIWTCSMHPQIRMPQPGKCPICGMDLIPAESGGAAEPSARSVRMSATARALARVQTTEVRRAFAETEVRMYGRIAYDETRLAYITAWVPGRLDRLYADYTGVRVNKGDHLVWMYSPELLSAQEELLQARAAVTALSASPSAELRLTAMATLESAREKLRLFGLTPEQIEAVERSGRTSDHVTIYSPIGGVVVHKSGLEGMYVQTGTRIYTIADLSHLWVMFEAYESDLPWLAFGQTVRFTSPSFPGETFEAHISFIDPLVDPHKRTVRVRAVVDNRDGRLKPDMFVRGVVHSRIDQDGHVLDVELAGRYICQMHPEMVRDEPGTCPVCGMDLVPTSSLGYAPEIPASPKAPLLVPASAPLITGRRAVVYVETMSDGDGNVVYEGREVVLGPRAGDMYVVRSGLREGERVVVKGQFKIDSELQIQARPSMMSPTGGAPPPGHHHGGDIGAGGEGAAGGGGARAAAGEARANRLETWLGELRRRVALERLADAFALVVPSRGEGGSQALVEALVAGVAVLASDAEGNVGLLGRDHPGLFPVGDAAALADLLVRVESDPSLHERLRARSRRLAPRHAPARERHELRALLAPLLARST